MADKIKYDWLKLPDVPDPEFGINFENEQRKKLENVTDGGYNWFVDPTGQTTGGQPVSKQEQQFIADYILKNNATPTQREVAKYMGTVSNEEYLPDSTMGKLGFKNWEEYLRAQQQGMGTYGVNADNGYGSLVPEEDWIVATDAQGNPIGRMGRDNVLDDVGLGYLQRGQFIAPPQGTYTAPNFTVQDAMGNGGFTFGDEPALKSGITGSPDANKYYRQPTTGKDIAAAAQWKDLTDDEIISNLDPRDLFTAQVSDWITNNTNKNAYAYNQLGLQLQDLSNQLSDLDAQIENSGLGIGGLAKGKTTTGPVASDANAIALENQRQALQQQIQDLQNQQLDLINPDFNQGIMDMVSNYAASGMSLEDIKANLALYGVDANEIAAMGLGGVSGLQLRNKINQQKQKEFQDNRDSQQQLAQQQALAGMGGGQQPQPTTPQVRYTGTEKTDFQDYVKNLGVSLNSQAWLYDNFSDLATKWQTKGRTGQTLMQFIQEYLATGGWNDYQAPDNRNRLAPTTIYR